MPASLPIQNNFDVEYSFAQSIVHQMYISCHAVLQKGLVTSIYHINIHHWHSYFIFSTFELVFYCHILVSDTVALL
jgi:hypothetical protein